MIDDYSSLDSDIILGSEEMQILKSVDEKIEQSLASGDLIPLLDYGRLLRKRVQANGLALVKLLATIRDNWYMYQSAGVEDDYISVIQAHLGLSAQTILKYCNLWDSLFANPNIPDNAKLSLMAKPIKTLLLLSAVARENQVEDWNEVISATNHHEVREVVRSIRGEQTSSSHRMTFYLDARTGQLTASLGSNPPENIGFLNITSESPLTKAAIARIKAGVDMLEV